MTRKPLPFIALDSLHPGDEIRVVLLTGDVCNATLVRSGTNWLTVRERETELQFRECDIEGVQRRSFAKMDSSNGCDVLNSIMLGDSKVVLS